MSRKFFNSIDSYGLLIESHVTNTAYKTLLFAVQVEEVVQQTAQ